MKEHLSLNLKTEKQRTINMNSVGIVSREAVYIFVEDFSNKNLIGLLCGMVAVPKHIFRIICAGLQIQWITQNSCFYRPCAAASPVNNF